MSHLHVITIDGARAGKQLLDSVGIGAPVSEPISDPTTFAARMHITGTPLLLHVTSQGRVQQRVIGEISEAEADTWARWAF